MWVNIIRMNANIEQPAFLYKMTFSVRTIEFAKQKGVVGNIEILFFPALSNAQENWPGMGLFQR